MNEHGLLELQERRLKLIQLKQTLDSDAPMNTEEGFWYAETLVKLVVIELQIEALQKEKAAQ